MKSFSETLTRLMKERSLSAKALAEQTGIPRSTLSEWVTGRKPKISNELIKLARFFGVSLEYLLTGKEPELAIIDEVLNKTKDEFIQLHQGIYRITVERKSGK